MVHRFESCATTIQSQVSQFQLHLHPFKPLSSVHPGATASKTKQVRPGSTATLNKTNTSHKTDRANKTTTNTTKNKIQNKTPNVFFVTLQTKGPSLLQKVGGPFKVVNLGAGKPWHGYKTKFELLLPFLRSKKDDDLVAFMDGSDIFWGGCEMNDFMHYYQQILEASGASIVISAEIACGEQSRDCNAVPTVPSWANQLANKSLSNGFWQKYAASQDMVLFFVLFLWMFCSVVFELDKIHLATNSGESKRMRW